MSVRLNEVGKAAVTQFAAEEERSFSDMCRVLIQEACAARYKQAAGVRR